MKASILTIGDEILIGQIVDTNSAFISQQLGSLGVVVEEMRSVGDVKSEITRALDALFAVSDLVVITGGLGPTKDDITKHTLAEYFGASRMVVHQPTLQHVTAWLTSRGISVGPLNEAQALVPDVCEVMMNAVGTAPGMWFERNSHVIARSEEQATWQSQAIDSGSPHLKVAVSLPGVPYEMEYLVVNELLPRVKKRFALGRVFHKNIITTNIAESKLAEVIAEWESALPQHLRLAYLPSFAGVKLRLSCYNADQIPALEADVAARIQQLQALIPQHIVGFDDDTLESVIGKLLKAKNATLATAESCTGGRVAAMVASVPGASAYYKGSVVAYANEAKVNLLGVAESDLKAHGAVSREVVEQMATGARRTLHTDYAIATSGTAGPDGGTPQKPVGTVWIAVATPQKVASQMLQLGNNRERTTLRAAVHA
ncbi:MAG: nicotinamide-nucleotide amidohydrolase family protein, partial [Prevotellaceae bacterium]|nr:nicotinamide-nucleotide amidohydrolase family protein [Prevotellaceae bacterium]